MKKVTLLAIVVLLLSSCSIKYNKIYPNLVEYDKVDSTASTILKYSTDVLEKSSNKYIEKKAYNLGYSIISVSITNKTNRALSFNENLFLRSEKSSVFLLDQTTLVGHLKRDLWWHLLWIGAGAGVQYFRTVQFVNLQLLTNHRFSKL